MQTKSLHSDRGLTPNQLAQRYGVSAHKVIAWIYSGELRAIDVASADSSKPRYRILPEDMAAFEASRATKGRARQRRAASGADPSDVLRERFGL